MVKEIEHTGFVKDIEGQELKVIINAEEACASCNLKSNCSVSDVKEKIIDIKVNDLNEFKVGENVTVYFNQSLGFRALFLGYVLPFLILLITLITVNAITEREIITGIACLVILVPYYLILYFSKSKIKRTFSFSVKKPLDYKSLNTVNI